MALSRGTTKIKVEADLREYLADLKKAEAASLTTGQKIAAGLDKAGDKMKAMGATLTRRVTLPILALGGLAAKEVAEVEKINVQTKAALESTGNAAHVTAKDISNLASKMQKLAAVDAEEVQAAENVLLTFTRVRNEVGKGNAIFDKATKAVLNMSARLGTDLQGATIQVGKALNDPIKGVTALGRAGVQFTEHQKKVIESLVESGDHMGAQKVILAELEKQFGGSAKAAGDTFAGKVRKLGFESEDAGAKILKKLMPHLQALVGWLRDLAQKFGNLSPKMQRAVLVFAGLAAVAGPVISAIGAIAGALSFLVAHPLVALVAAVVGVTVLVVKKWDVIKAATQTAFGAVGDTITNVWSGIKDAFGAGIAFVLNLVQEFLRIWLGVAGGIIDAAAWAFGWIPGIGGKIKKFQEGFHNATERILGDLDRQIDRFNGWEDGVSGALRRAGAQWDAFAAKVNHGMGLFSYVPPALKPPPGVEVSGSPGKNKPPLLDRGGIVTGPALVRVGPIRERVRFEPLTGPGAGAAPSGGDSFTFNIKVEAGSVRDERRLVRLIEDTCVKVTEQARRRDARFNRMRSQGAY